MKPRSSHPREGRLGPAALLVAVAVAVAAAAAGCAGSRPAPDADGGRETPVDGIVDWAGLDARFPRRDLIRAYMFIVIPSDKGVTDYVREIRPDAGVRPVDLAAFAALPEAERSERRAAAHRWRERALGLMRVHRDWWRMIAENPGGFRPLNAEPLEFAGDGITETLRHLGDATATDPTDAGSWYDLSCLYGLVGDTGRQAAAQAACLAALDTKPERADAAAIRLRTLLDRAWLLREQGYPDSCLTLIGRIGRLLREDEARTPEPAREAQILQGLALAEAGRHQEARLVARRLAGQRLPRLDRWTVGAGNLVQRNAHEQPESDFARRWIRAVVYRRTEQRDLALAQFNPADELTEFPPHLNYRFWNDVGMIREHFGEIEDARKAYVKAAVYRPFFIYFPMIGARGSPRVYGHQGTGRTYFLGYRHFYVGGSLFSYAANRVIALELADDPALRRELVAQARDALGLCLRRGIHTGAALALRGRVNFRAGDEAAAEADLTRALALLGARGRDDPDSQLILGIVRFNAERYDQAVEPLQTYVTLRPREAVGWRLLGLALIHSGRTDAALTALDQALRLEPDSPQGLYNRGLLHMQQGRLAQARADIEAAHRLWPENGDIVRVRDLLEAEKPPRINVTHGDMELTVSPADSTALAASTVSSLMLVAGGDAGGDAWLGLDARDARDLLAEVRERYRGSGRVADRRAYAWCLLQAGQPAEVRRLLGPLWNAGIDREELAILLRADRALGLPAHARGLVARLDQGPPDPADSGFWELVAAICLENGDAASGRRALDAALELDPENAQLRRLRDGDGQQR